MKPLSLSKTTSLLSASKPTYRLINPAKSEIEKISKQLLDRINTTLVSKLKLNQWKNTKAVLAWFTLFTGIQHKAVAVIYCIRRGRVLPIDLHRLAGCRSRIRIEACHHLRRRTAYYPSGKKFSSLQLRWAMEQENVIKPLRCDHGQLRWRRIMRARRHLPPSQHQRKVR